MTDKRDHEETTAATATEEPTTKRLKTATDDKDTAVNGFNASQDIDNAADLLKISSKSLPLLPKDSQILLLDIEGCTTSISFVKDVLFPFALDNLSSYLDTVQEDEKEKVLGDICKALEEDVQKLDQGHPSKEQIQKADLDGKDAKTKICTYVQALMSNDVKATGLKSLQGKIWKNGYATGQLKGHTYQDFQSLLEWCKKHSVKVYIYSSGSIGAQKLLFGHSIDGDLCPHFAGHYDTTSGGKKEAQSYKNIAKDMGVDVKDITFVSDAEGELVAAREAGVGNVVMSIRPGNAPLTSVGEEFPMIFSLLQLCGSGK